MFLQAPNNTTNYTMAITKNPLVRYKILDKCFKNPGKNYFIQDLIDECVKGLLEKDANSNGVSKRQVQEDIAFMESNAGWSIDLERHTDGRRVYYRYTDTSFSINNMPLNEIEINQLKSALDILSQFKGMPQFEWVHELLPKLQQGAIPSKNAQTIIEFDNNPYLKGIENLGILHNAILYKKILCINYLPFKSEEALVFTIHPYYLKQYNSRWFLFGYNPETDKYDWNLALDRIVSIKEIRSKYNNNSSIDWNVYFEDMIGVTKSEKAVVEKVTLQFIKETGKYIESKPIHGSQKSKWIDKGFLEVHLQIMLNYELERFILSYGDSVKVIRPKKLVDLIKARLQNVQLLYE